MHEQEELKDREQYRTAMLAALVQSQLALADLLGCAADVERSVQLKPDQPTGERKRETLARMQELLAESVDVMETLSVKRPSRLAAPAERPMQKQATGHPTQPWLSVRVYRGRVS